MGSVFIEPLQERDRVGEVFISHVSDDEQRIKKSILHNFTGEGIPYFLSNEDIEPGEDWLERLEQAINRASCGVVVLTENSLESEWIWYETGLLDGLNKPIYPLFLDDIDMSEIPEFITRKQMSREISELLETLQGEVRELGEISRETGFETGDLRRVTITMTLDTDGYPATLIDSLSFGYQLIGFGSPVQSEAEGEEDGREELLLMPRGADSVVRESNAIKVEYSVPLHKTFGVEFKPYVEVENIADIDSVINMLQADIFRDPNQSASGERQRIYFLLPIDLDADQDPLESGNVVSDGSGNLNNWLYPQ